MQSAGFTMRVVRAAVALLSLLAVAPVFGLTIITVTNISDSGPGSLRNAIATAPNGALINFNLAYPATILLSAPITLGPSVNIAGPGPNSLTISGGNAVPVFIVNAGADVQISGLSILNGSNLLGGGIFNGGTLTLNNVAVFFCTGQLGGGIFNSGTLTLTNSKVEANTAGSIGAVGGAGGGIYNFGGTLTISRSQISGNVAEPGPGESFGNNRGVGGGIDATNSESGTPSTVSIDHSSVLDNQSLVNGAGIEADGGSLTEGTVVVGTILTVSDSTIAGNVGTAGNVAFSGTGIFAGVFSQTTITNSTIALNSIGIEGDTSLGSNIAVSFSTIASNSNMGVVGNTPPTFKNSILSANGTNCSFGVPGTSDGYNLSDDLSCFDMFFKTGDLNDTPAGLDPNGLGNNGGPTQTIALLAGSPAIDAIPVSACTDQNGNPVTQDQRGVPRPQGSACDMGAFEYFPSKLLSVAVDVFQIMDSVEALSITPEQQQNLDDPLQVAVDSVNRGNTIPASNQLGAFINQANALVRVGVLTQGQGSGLTAQAQAVIQELKGGN